MDTKLTKTQDTVLNELLRHILTAAGGALVTRGTIGQSELNPAVDTNSLLRLARVR